MSNEKSKNYSFKRKNLNESYKATVVPINSPTAILLPPMNGDNITIDAVSASPMPLPIVRLSMFGYLKRLKCRISRFERKWRVNLKFLAGGCTFTREIKKSVIVSKVVVFAIYKPHGY